MKKTDSMIAADFDLLIEFLTFGKMSGIHRGSDERVDVDQLFRLYDLARMIDFPAMQEYVGDHVLDNADRAGVAKFFYMTQLADDEDAIADAFRRRLLLRMLAEPASTPSPSSKSA